MRYSMWSKGAASGKPLKDSATLLPVPVIRIAIELPCNQVGRSTISWMTKAISGVCWSGPASPIVDQGAGDQDTAAVVLGLAEIFPDELEKVMALSTASAWMRSIVGSELTSSTWN